PRRALTLEVERERLAGLLGGAPEVPGRAPRAPALRREADRDVVVLADPAAEARGREALRRQVLRPDAPVQGPRFVAADDHELTGCGRPVERARRARVDEDRAARAFSGVARL